MPTTFGEKVRAVICVLILGIDFYMIATNKVTHWLGWVGMAVVTGCMVIAILEMDTTKGSVKIESDSESPHGW